MKIDNQVLKIYKVQMTSQESRTPERPEKIPYLCLLLRAGGGSPPAQAEPPTGSPRSQQRQPLKVYTPRADTMSRSDTKEAALATLHLGSMFHQTAREHGVKPLQ